MSNPDRLVVVKPRAEREVFERAGDHNEEERPHRGRPRPPEPWDSISEERRALLSSRPRSRRWRDLTKIDDKLDSLNRRLGDARRNLQEAEQAAGAARGADARTLAVWIAAGE